MQSNNRRVTVMIPSQHGKAIFDYSYEVQLQIGQIVEVPLRSAQLTGIVWEGDNEPHRTYQLKDVAVVTQWRLKSVQLDFLRFMSKYNMSDIVAVMRLAVPKISFTRDPLVLTRHKAPAKQLSPDQERASHALLKSFGSYSCFLLEGVTGSGKTEVYFALIEEALARNGQVLVLMPEIMLTAQFILRFEQRFGEIALLWHSKVNKRRKEQIWSTIACGKSCVVLGARSALFLPFQDLQLIVVDEEHEPSYKQEDGVAYNARDMAVAYASFAGCMALLCSATPSIETKYNVQLGKYGHLRLTERYHAVSLPKMRIIDMKTANCGDARWISVALQQEITKSLRLGEQALLFLNRKGFAPITLCKSCGYKAKCPHCEVFLVEYRSTSTLMCSHCGYKRPNTALCAECGSVDLLSCGPGIERISAEVKMLWPSARVLVVSSAEKLSGAEIVEQISSGAVDVIIGTQVIGKGFHFPKLNLVGFVDADVGLFGSDLRSCERVHQLIHQVSGRSGRETCGKVVVQTCMPNHALLKLNSAEVFYEAELRQRQLLNMPPFSRLISVLISGVDDEQARAFALSASLSAPNKLQVLGPIPAPISKLRDEYRYRLLIKGSLSMNVQKLAQEWLERLSVPKYVRIKVDVDPLSLL